MPRTCKTCKHPKRHEIDKALLLGESFRDIAGRYDLSKTSVCRHKDLHIKPVVKEALIQANERRHIITVQEVWELVTLLCLHDPAEWTNEFGAFRDLKDIPPDSRLAIQSVKRREIYNDEDKDQKSVIGETKEYKGYSRLQALELAAKLHAMLPAPQVQNNTQINLYLDKTDQELEYFAIHGKWPPVQ